MSLLEAVQQARGEATIQPTSQPTSTKTGSSLLNAVQYARNEIKPTVQPQPTQQTQPSIISKPLSLFKQISDVVTKKLNQVIPGGISAGVQRVKQTPLKEFFLPTATAGKPAIQYVTDTAKAVVSTIKGAGKLTPAYMTYRAVTGKPVTPKEYAKTVLDSGLGVLNVAWRVQPAAPLVGAGFNSWKAVRQYFQGKISANELIEAPMQGINNQPGLGEAITDNIKIAEAIDIVFLATMFLKPLASKKIGEMNLKAEEFNKAIEPLGLKPTDSMSKVEKVIRTETKKIPDAFTSNPSPESLARRTEITNALNAFKKAGVLDKKWAAAYDFLTGKLGTETKPFVPTPKELPTTIPPKESIESSVVQIKDVATGQVEFKTIPKGQLEEFKTKVDSKIAGQEIDGKVYHLTAKTPEEMKLTGAKDTGVASISEIPTQPPTGGVGGEGGVKPVEEVPKPKTPSKIAKSIEVKAIEQKLTEGFEGIAGYDKITIKKQAELASNLMKDLEKASKVIRGEEPLPEELRGTALITAAEEYIKETGDAKLAYELANSPLVSETSVAAQELRLAAEREPDSLTLKLQELKKAREQAVEQKTGKSAKEAVKNEVTKIKKEIKTPDKWDWGKFLKLIECP